MGFWTQPIGKTRAERKGRPHYSPVILGAAKTGYVQLTYDGWVKYNHMGNKTTLDAADVTRVEIEDGTELVRRSTLARTGGGAAAGMLLLGPLGLIAGLGLGAAAKKQKGGEKFLVIDTEDQTVFLQIPAKEVGKAQQFRQAIRAGGN